MNYCSNCGGKVVQRIPDDDERLRYTCLSCHMVHYQNPKMVVGCIPEKNGSVLLCRRAIPPRHGYWTIPAGFLEIGENVADAARREALEETGSDMEIQDLFSIITLVQYHQVYLIFKASLLDEKYGPTKESLEVRLFREDEIPWPDIAFSSIEKALHWYFKDRAAGAFTMHIDEII